MKPRRRPVILAGVLGMVAALAAVYAFLPPPSADLVMPEWPTRTIGPGITCEVPESLQPTLATGIDSKVTLFKSADMTLSFDFGWYSDPLRYQHKPQYADRTVRIGGRKARLVRMRLADDRQDQPDAAAVSFRNLAGSGKSMNHLTGWSSSATPAGQDLAEKIFRKIRFDEQALKQ